MEQRYRALRTIGTVYKIFGYIVLVLTILAVIGICGLSILGGTAINSFAQQYGDFNNGSGWVGGVVGGVIGSIIVIIYGSILSLSLIGFGEGVYLLLSIEENTRKIAILVEGQNKITPPPLQP